MRCRCRRICSYRRTRRGADATTVLTFLLRAVVLVAVFLARTLFTLIQHHRSRSASATTRRQYRLDGDAGLARPVRPRGGFSASLAFFSLMVAPASLTQGHMPQLDAGPRPPASHRGVVLVVQHDQARAAGPTQCCAQPGRVQDKVLAYPTRCPCSCLCARRRNLVDVSDARARITTLSTPATPSAAIEGIARLACSRSMRWKHCVQSANVRASTELKFLLSDACEPKVHALKGPFAEGSMR